MLLVQNGVSFGVNGVYGKNVMSFIALELSTFQEFETLTSSAPLSHR